MTFIILICIAYDNLTFNCQNHLTDRIFKEMNYYTDKVLGL